MITVGFARWSKTKSEQLNKQEALLRAAGAPSDFFLIEEDRPNDPEWERILNDAIETLACSGNGARIVAYSAYELGNSLESFAHHVSRTLQNGLALEILLEGSELLGDVAGQKPLIAGSAGGRFLTTDFENVSTLYRSIRRGRLKASEDTGRLEGKPSARSQLAPELREKIRVALERGGDSLRGVAKRFNVSLRTVQRIRDEQTAELSASKPATSPADILWELRIRAQPSEEHIHLRNDG